MLKKSLFISALCLAMASSLHAVTITQDFATNPAPASWTNVPTSGSNINNTFTYNANGYLEPSMQRAPSAVGEYYTLLDQRYYMPNSSGVATVSDIYTGFDMQMNAALTNATNQVFMVGLFNSAQSFSTTSSLNSLGFEPIKTNVSMIRLETQNATTYVPGDKNVSVNLAGDVTYRIQTHYYFSGGNVLADAKISTVNVTTGVLTQLVNQTGIVLYTGATQWDTVGMDAFGIRNMNIGSQSKTVKMAIDNMYFSTDGEQTMGNAGWVTPEPATMVLLGLGSLLISRRRKA